MPSITCALLKNSFFLLELGIPESSEVLQSDQFPLLGPPNQAGQNWTRVKGKTLRTGHGEVRIQVLAITNKENLSKLINLGKLQFPHLLKQIMQHLAQLGAL